MEAVPTSGSRSHLHALGESGGAFHTTTPTARNTAALGAQVVASNGPIDLSERKGRYPGPEHVSSPFRPHSHRNPHGRIATNDYLSAIAGRAYAQSNLPGDGVGESESVALMDGMQGDESVYGDVPASIPSWAAGPAIPTHSTRLSPVLSTSIYPLLPHERHPPNGQSIFDYTPASGAASTGYPAAMYQHVPLEQQQEEPAHGASAQAEVSAYSNHESHQRQQQHALRLSRAYGFEYSASDTSAYLAYEPSASVTSSCVSQLAQNHGAAGSCGDEHASSMYDLHQNHHHHQHQHRHS